MLPASLTPEDAFCKFALFHIQSFEQLPQADFSRLVFIDLRPQTGCERDGGLRVFPVLVS